ncbi:MAG: hypothetical protein IH623_04285 [Verrucomicrobia bacterium]|nr:hypothetical protein [Verrucomicrobiota bacterium]
MNPFWTTLSDNLKVCGRNAKFFLCVVIAFFGVPVLIAVVSETRVREYLLPALPWAGVVALAWLAVAIHRARARRRERLERRPLSCDELRVARSKLMKDRNLKANVKVL